MIYELYMINNTVNNTVNINKYYWEYPLLQSDTDTRKSRNPDHHQYFTIHQY